MGFKRTSEGRVYFRGEEAPATKPVEYRSLSSQGAPQQNGVSQGTQLQIVSLLKTLNEKLQVSQTERARQKIELESYKKVIEELADKATRQENAYRELEQKMALADKGAVGKAERAEQMTSDALKELQETRKLVIELEEKSEKTDKSFQALRSQMGQTRALSEEVVKRQASYGDVMKRLVDAEKAQESLTQKIDETMSQQSKMLRQIEKALEDRARFMRKVERLEEAVIQTRDALNAKAMVLLTEQEAAPRIETKPVAPTLPEQLRETARPTAEAKLDWRKLSRHAAVVIGVLGLGVFTGWAASKIRLMNFSAGLALPSQEASLESLKQSAEISAEIPPKAFSAANNFESDISESREEPEITPQESDNQLAERAEALKEEDKVVPSPAYLAAVQEAVNDIGAVDVSDTAKLAKMLDREPEKVAAALNAIEPGAAPSVAKSTEAASLKIQNPLNKENTEERPQGPSFSKPDKALPPEAREIEKQAFAGVAEAQHDLAAIYTAGQGGVKRNYGRAAFWFRKAADQGVANARYNLGVLYHQGMGVKKDIKEAIRWYQSAADLGHPEAQYNLGIAYIEGIGVSYDAARAADNFEKAANKGITEAAYNLGLIHENGLLGGSRPAQALEWYKKAADGGSAEAKEALAELAKNLDIPVEEIKNAP